MVKNLNKLFKNINGNDFIKYCLNNRYSLNAIKKLSKYTSDWKDVIFLPEEIDFLINVPKTRNLIGTIIYRGENINTLKKGINHKQFLSWTLNKNNTNYFMRGSGIPKLIKGIIKPGLKFIDIPIFFASVNSAITILDENYNKTKEEKILFNVLSDIRLYDEDEIITFNGDKYIEIIKNNKNIMEKFNINIKSFDHYLKMVESKSTNEQMLSFGGVVPSEDKWQKLQDKNYANVVNTAIPFGDKLFIVSDAEFLKANIGKSIRFKYDSSELYPTIIQPKVMAIENSNESIDHTICPTCSEPYTSQCKCMKKNHTLEDLKKGHGFRCKNSHKWSYDENNKPIVL